MSLYKSIWVLSVAARRAITSVVAKEHLSPYNSLILEFQRKITDRGVLVGDNHHSSFWNSRHLSRVERSMNLVYTTVSCQGMTPSVTPSLQQGLSGDTLPITN